ncbi:hypothetical protein [Nesterenkonia alba]|uniref:hypothetical protein n=1 Tax=Nesterenkonia alba TaxID=515814 RepID=UPI0003B659E8|nr:hypothetical protein [Nesterenkonia alba]
MRNTALTPALSVLGVALLVASCAAEATPEDENAPAADGAETTSAATEDAEEEGEGNSEETEESDDPTKRPPEVSGETVDVITDNGEMIHGPVPVEIWVECDDPEALAENEGHEPAGWPQDWDGEGAMPEPECHPDYIEMLEWDQFESFTACWEGEQTSLPYSVEQFETEADLREALWNMSQSRADWPGYEGTCEEQVAQHEEAGGYD